MSEIRIVIPWDVCRTAENRTRRGGHWAQRAKLMKAARKLAADCWQAAGSPVSAVKVRVSVISRRGRVMDTCNVVGGLKPLLDGVFVKAMTPDDGPKWLELGGVTQITGKQWRDAPEVEFIIEAAGVAVTAGEAIWRPQGDASWLKVERA